MRFGLIGVLCAALSVSAWGEETFQAGAATSNITPPLGLSIAGNMRDRAIQNIHDELHARCLVLDDGETVLVFAIVDSCMIPYDVVQNAKGQASDATGIAPENMLVAATHTHSAPAATSVFQSGPDPAYQAFLATRIADGITRAYRNRAPAHIGWGSGAVPDEVFNRRWFMKAGTVPANPFGETTDRAKMNPPRASDDLLDPVGTTDPEVAVLAVQHADGRPMAVLSNYSLHYVGGEGAGEASADYFAVVAEGVAERLGARGQDPPFVAMHSNGTSGDINNINFREIGERKGPYEQMTLVGEKVAKEVARVYEGIAFQDWVELEAHYEELTLGVRLPSESDVARAKERLGEEPWVDLKTLEDIYARETALLAEYPEEVPVPLQAFRIGALGIGAAPCEVFVEIGLAVKAASPFEETFVIELANGYNGYLPTKEQHALGGYETWRARSSYLEVDAAAAIQGWLIEALANFGDE